MLSTWQYAISTLPFDIIIVCPPAPLNPVNVTIPFMLLTRLLPVGAAISMPLWYVLEPAVGAFLYPNSDVIFVYPYNWPLVIKTGIKKNIIT